MNNSKNKFGKEANYTSHNATLPAQSNSLLPLHVQGGGAGKCVIGARGAPQSRGPVFCRVRQQSPGT